LPSALDVGEGQAAVATPGQTKSPAKIVIYTASGRTPAPVVAAPLMPRSHILQAPPQVVPHAVATTAQCVVVQKMVTPTGLNPVNMTQTTRAMPSR